MHILITGANGQLGQELAAQLTRHSNVSIVTTDIDTLDLTREDEVNRFFDNHHFDYAVNCAAYTAVDRAESQPELCRLINADAIEILGRVASRHACRVVHVSTDYVFDGKGHRPYREDDPTGPTSVYGATKLEGEQRLMQAAPDSVIVRTAWLYSPHGKNFVKTMLELGRTRDSLSVVCDQVGTPTSATSLARAITAIVTGDKWQPGIYHYTDEGAISWYDFTIAIHRLAGITSCRVTPCLSSEYPTAATRPFYSVLDKSKIKSVYGLSIPHWLTTLEEVLARLSGKR